MAGPDPGQPAGRLPGRRQELPPRPDLAGRPALQGLGPVHGRLRRGLLRLLHGPAVRLQDLRQHHGEPPAYIFHIFVNVSNAVFSSRASQRKRSTS